MQSLCRHTHFSQRSRHDCMAAANASLGDLRSWTHHVLELDIHCVTVVTVQSCISLQPHTMRWDLLALIITKSILTVSGLDPDLEMEQIPDDEARARIYLDYLDKEFGKRATQSALAEWAYASNITEENLKNKVRYGCSLIQRSHRHSVPISCPSRPVTKHHTNVLLGLWYF